jgi:hypothetical protein
MKPDDGLRFYRGLLFGILLSIPLWVLIYHLTWWVIT